MTRSMNSRLDCPSCRCKMTMETHFERWMREEDLLDSRTGIVRYDLDVLLHKYMDCTDGFGDRTIQCLMFIEVKTFGAQPSDSQKDTLHLLNQVLRNRRPNINGNRNKWNAGDHVPLAKCRSLLLGQDISLRLFGGHVLVFERNGPDDSSWIEWDKKRITKKQLIGLLRFEIDPDDPRCFMDIRRRSRPLFDSILTKSSIDA